MHPALRLTCAIAVAAGAAAGGGPRPLAQTNSDGDTRLQTAGHHHQRGVDFHLQRRLDEAAGEYATALRLDPPRPPSADEQAAILRFMPRIFTTPDEVFPLRDAAAVMHPTERLIAYHLFWEDDIDFPEDNDPCDHEVVWVRFSADRRSIEGFWTYFHGRILDASDAARRDAAEHDMRPRVNVQWGKHGSMPYGWEAMTIVGNQADLERAYYAVGKPITLAEYNQGTWKKLNSEGRRLIDHPIARRARWPDRFTGGFDRFTDFSREVDFAALLRDRQMAIVSRWNNAVINQHFLTYNYRPKTEWPIEPLPSFARTSEPQRQIVEAQALDDFKLPARSVFDPAMPRYPNVWFYLDSSLADSYGAAVRLVADQLRGPMRLREDHGPFGNPEACDFEVRLEHLQPWEDAKQRPLQHAHAFHMRYYHSVLEKQQLERVTLKTSHGERAFYRIAASAHYEVEHTNPNHADVEICPICGRTGEYQDLKGNLVEMVHDPLGVELLLNGTIRNQPVSFDDDQRAFVGIGTLRNRFAVQQQTFQSKGGEQNTLRIGVVVLAPPP